MHAPSNENARQLPPWVSPLLVVIWLALTASAFWLFNGRFVRPFEQNMPQLSTRIFSANALAEQFDEVLKQQRKGLVVHFYDPNCPCTKFSQPHVQELIERSERAGLNSVVVVKTKPSTDPKTALDEARRELSSHARFISSDQVFDGQSTLTGSPSAAVFDAHGQLRFAGPYSSDAFCRTGNSGFVEAAISKLDKPIEQQTAATGFLTACYCDWS